MDKVIPMFICRPLDADDLDDTIARFRRGTGYDGELWMCARPDGWYAAFDSEEKMQEFEKKYPDNSVYII